MQAERPRATVIFSRLHAWWRALPVDIRRLLFVAVVIALTAHVGSLAAWVFYGDTAPAAALATLYAVSAVMAGRWAAAAWLLPDDRPPS